MKKDRNFNQIFNETRHLNVFVLTNDEQFKKLEWARCVERIREIAALLEKNLGKEKRLFALYHPDALTWDLCNFALKTKNMAIVGINHLDNPEQIKQILASVPVDCFITSRTSLSKVQGFWNKSIISIDFNAGFELEIEFINPLYTVSETSKVSDGLCEIITSSGTTGPCKTFSYSQKQILSAIDAINTFYKNEMTQVENTISWMPLANPFQRILNLVSIVNNISIYYVNDPKRIIEYCTLAHIGYLASIPRLYEKIIETIQLKFAKTSVFAQFFKYILAKLTQANLSQLDKLKIGYFHLVLGSMLRKKLGGGIQFLISGSSPLPAHVDNFYRNIGLPIYQAYGMSENIIPICLSNSENNKPGSVGKIIKPNIVKIENGLVCIKSEGLHQEFLQQHPNEFFLSGDLGEIDIDGYLFLKGRESDFFKLSTGIKIYPLKIEECLKTLLGVNFACVLGAGRKTAWAILDVSDYFLENNKDEEMIRHSILSALRSISVYERPTQFIILKNSFSINGGEITGNLKLKRKYIEEKYTKCSENIKSFPGIEFIINLEHR
jgi:long-chain acyl-CoA synthetase